jgi:hypothetical protein
LQLRQQPAYNYPQLPEDRSYLGPPTSTPQEQSSNVTLSSFDYAPTYNQISQSSSLLPSPGQYPHTETSQIQYTSYPDPGYSDHQQPQHDYFPGSQHAFDRRIPAIADSSYPATSVSTTYTSPPIPHQFSELGQVRDFSARPSLPAVTTPDSLAPAFSGFDVSFHHGQTTGSNKRLRSEEHDEDGDVSPQTRGDATQLSAAEKLKRACARCRGLKVRPCQYSQQVRYQAFVDRFAATLGTTMTHVIDVSRPPKSASFQVGSRDDPHRALPS